MVSLLPEVLPDDVESSLPGCDEVPDLLDNAWVEPVSRRLGRDVVARLTVKLVGLLRRQLHVEPCHQQVTRSSAGHITHAGLKKITTFRINQIFSITSIFFSQHSQQS